VKNNFGDFLQKNERMNINGGNKKQFLNQQPNQSLIGKKVICVCGLM
jgi:hypothetical protein